MQKVMWLDDKYPDYSPKKIFGIFFKTDWDTLIVTGIIMFLTLLIRFILEEELPIKEIAHYNLYTYGIALTLGYAGQRIIYKIMGKAESTLSNKIDNFKP